MLEAFADDDCITLKLRDAAKVDYDPDRRAVLRGFADAIESHIAALGQRPTPTSIRDLNGAVARAAYHLLQSRSGGDDAPNSAAGREGARLAA